MTVPSLARRLLLGFLPDADSFAHYAEARFGTLCCHYSEDYCAHYARIMPKFSKTRRAWRADLAHHHHFSAPCTNNVHKDWVTKGFEGWKSVPEMEL